MKNSDKVLDSLMKEEDSEEDSQAFKKESEFLEPLMDEIGLISSQPIQYFVRSLLMRAQEFWYAPSDCSPGVFPPDEYKDGGLVTHTKRVVRIASLLAKAYEFNSEETDIVIAASLLHDITKTMKLNDDEDELFYDPMHPYTVGRFVTSVHEEDRLFGDESQSTVMYIEDTVLDSIMRCVRCHLGLMSPVPETVPITMPEMVVHLADLLASKVHYIIDGEEINYARWDV